MKEEEYLDLVFRAAAIRHFLAHHPNSTMAEIMTHFHPVRSVGRPLNWLMEHDYVSRKENPGSAPTYKAFPLGTKFEDDVEEPSPLTPKEISEIN